MTRPVISIIMPVYNAAPWLAESLESIIAQNYQNWEAICVNDGSTDESGAILNTFAQREPRIKVIHQQNQGVAAARNTALNAATGEWLTGVDPDDKLMPGIYEEAVQHLNADIDMLVFGTVRVDEKGDALPPAYQEYYRLPGEGTYPMTPEWGRTMSVCLWNKLWRRSLITENDIKFPVGLLYEDEAFFRMYLPLIRSVYVLPRIGYHYMKHTGSIVHTRDTDARLKWGRAVLAVAQYVESFYERQQLAEKGYEHLAAFLWRSYVAFAELADDIEEGFRALAQRSLNLPAARGDRRMHIMATAHRSVWRTFFIKDTEIFREYRIGKFPLCRLYYSGRTYREAHFFPRIIAEKLLRRSR